LLQSADIGMQAMVDASPTFPEMLKRLEKWMDGHDLRREDGGLKDALWVTDGVSQLATAPSCMD
jgi:hypothetical protein